jgi:hypothetical protein
MITREKARSLTGKLACRGQARVGKIIYGEEGITRIQGRDHYPEPNVFIMVEVVQQGKGKSEIRHNKSYRAGEEEFKWSLQASPG